MELVVVPRREPLAPSAVLGVGEAARSLFRRLRELPDERLLRLRAARSEVALLVCGDASELPWADGVVYLARDADAPSLLLPTTLTVEQPVALLERALEKRLKSEPQAGPPPWAVCFSPWLVLSAGSARPVVRAKLRDSFEQESGSRV
jgi:hypothetical protein